MKQQYLEALIKQHNRYLSDKTPEEPKLEFYIKKALSTGEKLRLRPVDEITNTAVNRQITDRYNTQLCPSEVFMPTAEYTEALTEYQMQEAARKDLVDEYLKATDQILLKAEFDPESDPMECATQLLAAAMKCGLKTE